MRRNKVKIWDVFWYWTVIWEDEKINWIRKNKCKCKCWREKYVTPSALISWSSWSCWCKWKLWWWCWESSSRFYWIWCWMKSRCNPKNYVKDYWKRWIHCKWKTYKSFKKDMYESYLEYVREHWEENITVDRIDTNWNYNKENCRWLSMLEQQSNKRNNHHVIYRWKEYPTIKWLCDILWKNYHRVFRRITTYGWSVEDAIEK